MSRVKGSKNPTHTSGHDDAHMQVRRMRAVELRVAGYTYRQISKILEAEGFRATARETVNRDVRAALQEFAAQEHAVTEELRALELARLDAIHESLWPSRANPATAKVLIQLSARRARIAGLDAPTRVIDETPQDHRAILAAVSPALLERVLAEVGDT